MTRPPTTRDDPADAGRDPVADALDTWTPRSAADRSALARLRALPPDATAWDRSTPLHLTGSALVVHPPTRRVLLRWHERQRNWLQVGGHADPGEVDPLAVAQREAAEETGLSDLIPWPDHGRPTLVQAVIVSVPAGRGEPAHEHGDLRYLLATDRPDDARPEHDGAHLRWLSIDEAQALTDEANVAELLTRAAELFDRTA